MLYPCTSFAQFHIPEDGLPQANIGQIKITFIPNGAFVVSRNDITFMDGGLGFANNGWKRWGDQIRGAMPPDRFLMLDDDGMTLTFSGILRDSERKDVFRFQQDVSLQANGLRFSYTVTPIESIPLQRLGITFHFPIRCLSNQKLEFLPGFLDMLLPSNFLKVGEKGYLGAVTARHLVVARDTDNEVAVSLNRPSEWMIFDDRAYELDAYRVWLNHPIPKDGLSEQGLNLGFEISFDAFTPITFATPAPKAKQTLPVALSPVPYGMPPELTRRKDAVGNGGVTFNPDGSLTIWHKGKRAIEACLILEATTKPTPANATLPQPSDSESSPRAKGEKPAAESGKVLTLQSEFAAPNRRMTTLDDGPLQVPNLVFSGVIVEAVSRRPIQYRQEVRETEEGLKIHYTLKAAKVVAQQLGEPSDSLRAGLALVLRPGMFPEQSVEISDASAIAVGSEGGLRVEFRGPKSAGWAINSQKKWKGQIYHALLSWPKDAQSGIKQGNGTSETQATDKPIETLSFELDVLLPTMPSVQEVVKKPEPQTALTKGRARSQAQEEAAPGKSIIVLPDDTTTQGDWQGRYGTYAYILCGRYSPLSAFGGPGRPIEYRVYTGDPEDTARVWLSSLDASLYKSALWNPHEQNRKFSTWDDHGETYPRGKGPDLYIDISIPKGPFILSLYFLESDWIQYRAYTVTVREKEKLTEENLAKVPNLRKVKAHKVLAATTVDNFFQGKYKRFLVLGPADLTVKIAREGSPNATLGGLFLDQAAPLLPIPYPKQKSRPKNAEAAKRSLAELEEAKEVYETSRQLQAEKSESLYASGIFEDLGEMINACLTKDISSDQRAEALWMLWQCQEQIFAPKQTALKTLTQYVQAIQETCQPSDYLTILRETADSLYKLRDLDAAETVLDGYIDAIERMGDKEAVVFALERSVFQYFTLNADNRYALRKWDQYLRFVPSHYPKQDAIEKLRSIVQETFDLAKHEDGLSNRADRTGYYFPVMALRKIREHYSQAALSDDDQELLALSCKSKLLFTWGLDDYLKEYETLLRCYPNTSERAAIYFETLKANLLLAQKSNDHARAIELTQCVSQEFPLSQEAANAELWLIDGYYLYRGKYAEARTALKRFQKRYSDPRWAASVAYLHQEIEWRMKRRSMANQSMTNGQDSIAKSQPRMNTSGHE